MILRRTCKEAAALMLAREDRALALADRIALRLHLAACKACLSRPRDSGPCIACRAASVASGVSP